MMSGLTVAFLLVLAVSVESSGTDNQLNGDVNGNSGNSQANLPFTIQCIADQKGTVNVKAQNALIGTSDPVVSCTPNPANTYSITDKCMTKGKFIIETTHTVDGHDIKTAAMYQVTCDGGKGELIDVNSESQISVNQITGPPSIEPGTLPKYGDDKVKLFLLSKDPTTIQFTEFGSNKVTGARLGDQIYLTLTDIPSPSKATLIPLNCQAKINSESVTLWNFNDEAQRKSCTKEKSVMKTAFSHHTTATDNHYVAVATMEVFQFNTDPAAQIAIHCQVRVCTASSGLCSTDADALDNCEKQRRRRQIDDSLSSKGPIHEVTATLRVYDNVNGYATDGSATLTISLPCLLVSLLAKMFL